jgi:hypothetical protein
MRKIVTIDSMPSGEMPCRRLQNPPRRHQVGEDSPLTPALKAFIDDAIVPILVKEYMAELQKSEGEALGLAEKGAAVAQFPGTATVRGSK